MNGLLGPLVRWAGVANELAVVGFVACAAALAVRAVVVR